MNKNLMWAAVGSVAVVTVTGAVVLASRSTALKEKLQTWKNERIRNAYYDTLTEKDIAWG